MNEVRVRFAPSPTGYLHVGGLRTALYNYLFAKNKGGKFILRIEDTDRTRYVEGAVENLINSLRWSGLEFDEGPDNGGEYGPYIQSERTELYRKHAQELVDSGNAYYCFCSSERLDDLRNRQKAQKLPTRYDKKCQHLPKDEVEKRIAAGEPYVVRLNVPMEGEIVFEDEVRGKIKMNYNEIDDQVLLKSDGFPTYHLANVVDDHYMKISHVIRGEEWLPSTPKHIIMYKALGWDVPTFAHLPLLLNPDRTKLSKRQGDVAVEDYMKKGYLAKSLINFIALLGWNKGDEQEIFTMEELIEFFTIERVNKAGAVFDIKKLNWINSHYLKEVELNDLMEMLKPYIQDAGYDIPEQEKFEYMISSVRDGLEYLSQIGEKIEIFYKDSFTVEEDEAKEMLTLDSSKEVFNQLITELEGLDNITPENFKAALKAVQKATKIKGKLLFMPTRIAISGQMHGPELNYFAAVLGKEKVIDLLKKQI